MSAQTTLNNKHLSISCVLFNLAYPALNTIYAGSMQHLNLHHVTLLLQLTPFKR